MKKRIKKRWIVTIILILFVFIFFLLFYDFSPRLVEKAWGKTDLTISTVIFKSHGTFTPSEPPEGMEFISSKSYLALFANMKTGDFALEDMRSKSFWYTTPLRVEEDELAKGNAKNEMYSVLTVTDIVTDTHSQKKRNTKIGSVNKDKVSVTRTTNGIEINFDFPDQKYAIPLQVILLEDSLKVVVDTSKIKENGSEKIFSVGILPYFGAQDWETEGKFILPDGSGSEMDFNNGKTRQSYRVSMYGEDAVNVYDSKPTETQKASLPVFGVLKKETGLLAVIEDGAGSAYVNASGAGGTTGFNNAYFEFNTRARHSASLGTGWNTRDVVLYEEGPIQPEFYSVRYFPVEEKNATTAGVAGMVREYLTVQENMKPANLNVSPLFIQTTGAIRTRESILGVKTDRNRATTTFSQAEDMAKTLKSLGIDSMFWRYDGWSTDALKQKVTAKINIPDIIGGTKGMENFSNQLSEMNSKLFLKEESINFSNMGSGANTLQDSVKNLSALSVKTKEYKRNTYFPESNSETGRLLVAPKAHTAFERLIKSIKNDNVGIGLGSLGSISYSNYSSGTNTRSEMTAQTEYLLKSSGKTYLGDNPSFYALSSCNSVINLPDSGSSYDMCDRSVPFVQMVLHGVIPFSGTPINLSGSPSDAILFSVRTGSFLSYSLSGTEPVQLKDYSFTDMYGASYKLWRDEIVKSYLNLEAFYLKTRDSYIVGYDELLPGVTVTSFSNGVKVVVNSSEVTFDGEDFSVNSKDFKLYGG